ncbi:MAG: ChaN family lipoprotein [Gammaproteobacteria bacterium]|nr:ChaN family lipoprotein [Gammaproteobacteria bacterium]
MRQRAFNGLSVLAAAILLTASALAADTTRLPIGDPERRQRTAPVIVDTIVDTRANEQISTAELVNRLADVQLVFFGENHTDMDFHRAQAQLIRSLHQAGREVFIGLEMFPYTRQPELDRWTDGELTETAFLAAAKWYESWGYRWEYYADIFRYARDNELRMFAVNSPRHVVKAVRTQGFDGLSDEDRKHIPREVVTNSEEHRTLFKASFESGDSLHADISEEALDGMLRAQATWDAVMGWNAVLALREHGGPNAIMVVLIGAGHVTYGLGSQLQIEADFDGNIASVVPVPVVDFEGKPIPEVQASYADFVWGLPPTRDPLYPSLGVSLMGSIGKDPNKIIQVGNDSIAAEADLRVGDILESIDGQEVGALGSLRQIMAAYNWGDSAEVQIGRADETITKEVVFRRKHP